MHAGRFDALARTLTSGASRRRILQALPGLAVGSVLPWSSAARALDAGNDPVAPPAGGDARSCTGGTDCAIGEICLNGYCQTAAGPATSDGGDALACPTAAPSGAASGRSVDQAAGGETVGQTATATPATGQAPAGGGDVASIETPSAAEDADPGSAGLVEPTSTPSLGTGDQVGAPPEPTPRSITTPAGQGGPNATPAAAGTTAAEIPPNEPLAAQLHEGVCGSLGDTPAFPLIDIGFPDGAAATPAAGGALGAEAAISARLSTTIVDATLADLLADPFALDIRLTVDDPDSSIACGEIGAQALPSGTSPRIAIGLATRNGSGYAGIASLQEQNGRTVVSVFVAPGLGGGTTAEFAVGDRIRRVAAAAEPTPFPAGATATLNEDVKLRAAPRDDASVVAELDEGTSVTVTAAPVDGWVPVRDAQSDRPGYVPAGSLAPEG